MRILELRIRKRMKELVIYAVEGAQAFDDLRPCVAKIGQISKWFEWTEATKRAHSEVRSYLKLEYKASYLPFKVERIRL